MDTLIRYTEISTVMQDPIRGIPEEAMMQQELLGVIVTTFNRVDKTLESLESVARAAVLAGVKPRIFLTDAGNDGTTDAVAKCFPHADIERVGSDVYWNRGMARSMRRAVLDPEVSLFLWLNDDVILMEDGLIRMLNSLSEKAAFVASRRAIVIGELLDPQTGMRRYGANYRAGKYRLSLSANAENDSDVPVTFHGNCVLITREVIRDIGSIDPYYTHGYGDTDFGLRAFRSGVAIRTVPEPVGFCVGNPSDNTWLDHSYPLRLRLIDVLGPKGKPIKDQIYFARKFAGPLWPYEFMKPYAGILFSSCRYFGSRSGLRLRAWFSRKD